MSNSTVGTVSTPGLAATSLATSMRRRRLTSAATADMSNHNPEAFEAAARAVGFLGFGTYPRSGFIHIDLGPARRWGEPFPPRAAPFAAEKGIG